VGQHPSEADGRDDEPQDQSRSGRVPQAWLLCYAPTPQDLPNRGREAPRGEGKEKALHSNSPVP
jgi:hypothetical protein